MSAEAGVPRQAGQGQLRKCGDEELEIPEGGSLSPRDHVRVCRELPIIHQRFSFFLFLSFYFSFQALFPAQTRKQHTQAVWEERATETG